MLNKSLGRGLESLIPLKKNQFVKNNQKEDADVKTVERLKKFSPALSESVILVETKFIEPNPHQPRKYFDEQSLKELSESIKIHGILQPLIATKVFDNQYQLLAGERRLQASKLAGLKQVPVIVRELNEQQKLEMALVENVQRQDLNPMEEALAYSSLIDEFNLKQEEVAKKVAKSRVFITNTLRLLTLPSEIQKAIFEKKISFGHAKAILSLKTEEEQMKLFRNILLNNLSVRDSESGAKKVKVKDHVRSFNQKTPQILDYEERLAQSLGTKVEIKKAGKSGKVIVDFFSEEELGNIMEVISGKSQI